MSQQRPKPPAKHHTASSSSHQSPVLFPTATFYASWRGQLLICTVVLIIGGICFVLREPIAKYNRRRQEVISSARMEELVSMEKETKEEKEVDEVKEVKKVNKEKKKDAKKRKGSLLKVPISAVSGESSATPSSIESSPAFAPRIPSPSTKPRTSPIKGKATALPSINDESITHSSSTSHQYHPKALEPSPLPRSAELQVPLLSPCDIPLPASPIAGPSRLGPKYATTEPESNDNDAESTSESAISNSAHTDTTSEPLKSVSSGFSIIPEEGYLPPMSAIPSGKKKKRKGRAAPPQPLPVIERRVSRSGQSDIPSTPGRIPESPVPMTPNRRARQASLTRPINADLDELLTEREKMIETLRAEIGLSKAEEAKAKDEVTQSRATEERLKGDIERIQHARKAAEHAGRKRESELNARLSHLSSHYTTALHRINALEAFFRDSSRAIPPASPAMPGQGPIPSPIPIPMHHLQPLPSPLPPSSPFGLGYGPSPRTVSAGFVPYPSPGMYPSPMLHPNMGPHAHSPSPFRRASTSGAPDDGLAGPLTPGQGSMPGSGHYPFDLGIMPSPSPSNRQPSPNGQLTAADLRRQSIESSVLKKKVKEVQKSGSESGEDSNRGSEPLADIEELSSVQGLGMGDVEQASGDRMERERTNGGSVSTSSHPSSPSPPNRASMLLTPASADHFQRAFVHGTDTPEEIAHRESLSRDMATIKVVPDALNGNLYYAESARSTNGSESNGSDNASAYDPQDVTIRAKLNGTQVNGHAEANGNGKKEEYVPMFASLAHTPQQLAEIQRMRDDAIRAREEK